MDENQKVCKHPKWAKCIIPWGTCLECGISIEAYTFDLLTRCLSDVSDENLKAELKHLLSHKE